MLKLAIVCATSVLACTTLSLPVTATPITAFQFPEPPPLMQSVTGSDGFRFTPTININVTALGYYDANQDGLALAHPVAIYQYDTQTQLALATVDQASTLEGSFRWAPITPLRLTAGVSYLVAGYHPGNTNEDFAATPDDRNVTIPSQITYQGYTYVLGGSTVQFTTTPYRDNFTFFGPNFQFEHAPEPVTFALTGIGLILLSVSGRILHGKR